MQVTFPLFSSSNEEINKTYEYRCESYNKHVKETPDGYVVTEFAKPVPWAGKYNTIRCAAMHHVREGRWLHESKVISDYLRFWCREDVTPSSFTSSYSFALADMFMDYVKVVGDSSIVADEMDELIRVHRSWDIRVNNGLYRQTCGYDGMEFSISGDGYRPTINSYMYADKLALSEFSKYLGKTKSAEEYLREADLLRKRINELLWNEANEMYGVVSDDGIMQSVKEQIGYIPWIYGIPKKGSGRCFRYLLDPECFLGRFGLRTADASHPEYMRCFDHECLWNGPVWPFATSQTLSAVINYLQTEDDTEITSEDFMQLLSCYAASHRDEDGSPYVDENLHPETGVWLAREIMRESNSQGKDRGAYYNHSTFVDLVITGLCGIRPSSGTSLTVDPLGLSLDEFSLSDVFYHGRRISVIWDKKTGLSVAVDGEEKAFCDPSNRIKLVIDL